MKYLLLFLIAAAALESQAQSNDVIVRKALFAQDQLEAGNAICFVSMWGFIPVVYDIGAVTMITARSSLASRYREKFHEDPPVFGESGEAAYRTGWLFKGAAVGGALLAGASGDRTFAIVAIVAFPILWLAGTMKHYEAQRLMYDDGINRVNLISDHNEHASRTRDNPLCLAIPVSF